MKEPNGRYILRGREPEPCADLATWARWYENADRQVAEDFVDGMRVSTVFLALDHSFLADGPPVLFETVVFGGPHDGEEERYSTWEDAVAGHKAMIARLESSDKTAASRAAEKE